MIRRFSRYYLPHRWLFALDMGAAFCASVVSVLFPFITRNLLKQYLPGHDLRMIRYSLAAILVIAVLKTAFTFIRVKWGHIVGVRMESDMRAEIFTHVQKLSFSYFDNVKTGHLMSRISGDLEKIAEIAHHAPEDLIISLCVLIGAFSFMFSFSPFLTAIALIPVIALVLWGWFYGRRMKSGFKKVRERIADINANVENSVQGIREVKSYTNEDLEISKFDDANSTYRVSKERIYHIMSVFYSGMEFWLDFYYFCVIGAGAHLIWQARIDTADLIAFTLYINIINKPVNRLVNFIEQLQQGAASFERFTEIMDIEPDIRDRKGAKDLELAGGHINIHEIEFSYRTSREPVLSGVSMEIKAGTRVALVGESGAGKSTLVSLIPRFYEPQQGTIAIDGQDIMDLTQRSLRESIGLVQQNAFLFDGTIRENIMYGNPLASEETMTEAARDANILDFILSLPDGFDTQVGERGVKLSGGQKQRVSIARVFLKNPAVLIFDEATSSLDSESESMIQEAMDRLARGRTTVIIAHRLSTIRNADVIHVMKNGKIIESGTHELLMERQGYYHSLYTRNLF